MYPSETYYSLAARMQKTQLNEIRLRELNEGPFKASVLEVVGLIPPGKVATYEDIAGVLGYPAEASVLVGWVIESTSDDDLPFHRVVKPDGTFPTRYSQHPIQQADLLGLEGVEVLEGPKVPLQNFRWQPSILVRSRGPLVSLK